MDSLVFNLEAYLKIFFVCIITVFLICDSVEKEQNRQIIPTPGKIKLEKSSSRNWISSCFLDSSSIFSSSMTLLSKVQRRFFQICGLYHSELEWFFVGGITSHTYGFCIPLDFLDIKDLTKN